MPLTQNLINKGGFVAAHADNAKRKRKGENKAVLSPLPRLLALTLLHVWMPSRGTATAARQPSLMGSETGH